MHLTVLPGLRDPSFATHDELPSWWNPTYLDKTYGHNRYFMRELDPDESDLPIIELKRRWIAEGRPLPVDPIIKSDNPVSPGATLIPLPLVARMLATLTGGSFEITAHRDGIVAREIGAKGD